jgi:hypothetical protein
MCVSRDKAPPIGSVAGDRGREKLNLVTDTFMNPERSWQFVNVTITFLDGCRHGAALTRE